MGCKEHTKVASAVKSGGIEFYLNYVGCKEHTQHIQHSNSSGFYLNYVGCKDILIGPKIDCIVRFTLTMWDVKNSFNTIISMSSLSFTLTMWDVKSKLQYSSCV